MMYERFYEVLNMLCSDQSPLGFKMVDYFWRVEEQGKTTLHFHLVGYFDSRQVPTDVNDVSRVPTLLAWVKKHVRCHIPTEEEDLEEGGEYFGIRDSVLSFQRHHHPNKCQDQYKSGHHAAKKVQKKNTKMRRSLAKRAADREIGTPARRTLTRR